MFNFSKKKTIIGLCGLMLSIGLIALFICLSPSGNITELPLYGVIFRILSLLFLSSAIGFIVYIFSNIKGFLLIFSIFAIMTIFRVIIDFTSKSSPSIALFLISLAGIVLLIIMSYNQYKSNTIAINGTAALSNKEKKEQEAFDNEMIQLDKEDEKLKSSIGYINNSIIVGTQSAGSLYQVIKMYDGFLFHYVGNILKGINQSKLIKDFSNIEINENNKKDYILKHEDILKISASIKNNYQVMDYGKLKISLKNGKNKRFAFINLFEEKELNLFFDNNIELSNTVKNTDETFEIDCNDKSKMNKLNKFFFIFSLISYVVFGIYFNFYNYIAHTILTTLCIIICLVPFVMYMLFPKYISLKEKYRYESSVQKGKLNIIQTTLEFPILFALMSLIDGYIFAYYDIIRLIIYSSIVFFIFIAILLIFSKEYKKEKSALVALIFIGLFLCPAVVHKIDMAYDFSPSQQVYCEIVDNPTWTNNNNEKTYYFTISYNNKEIKTEVSNEVYEKYKIGDEILVIRKRGALGIEKLILKE